jgi:hypothetical protein
MKDVAPVWWCENRNYDCYSTGRLRQGQKPKGVEIIEGYAQAY